MKIHHTGVVVRNIQEHFTRYLEPLMRGYLVGPVIHDPLQKVNVAFIEFEQGCIELVEPASTDSPVQAFATAQAAGFHHICFELDDLDARLGALRETGCVIVSAPKPAVAFGGRRICFVVTRDRLLWELLEVKRD